MMQPFGLTPQELERRGARWTAREIEQQPQVWRQVEDLLRSDPGGIAGFLDALLAKSDLRILLTGAGTSAFIGECLAPAMLRQHRHCVDAVPTTDIVSNPGKYLLPHVPTLLISFARSGNSPESTAAVEMAERCVSECYHLIVTCNPQGALYRRGRELPNGRVLLLPDETNDRGFAMTSSFSSMLLAVALAFRLPVPPIAGLSSLVPMESAAWLPRIQGLVSERFERVIYLGANELKGLARESALKMLELTDGRIVSIADTPLGFRHGPKTILNRQTAVIVFLSNDGYTRQYDLDLLAELRTDGIAGRVLALTTRSGAAAAAAHPAQPVRSVRLVGHPDDIVIPALDHASELGLCLPFIVFAQTFALLQSLALEIPADTPNAAGAVSRVVQGVSIYPLGRST